MGEQQVHPQLSPERLDGDDAAWHARVAGMPVKVLQIGEGNFLRGFADWMLQRMIRQGHWTGSVAVTQPRPAGKANMDRLKVQSGVYTLLVRGLQDRRRVDEKERIAVFSRLIDPYEQWADFLALAEEPDLRVVVSNTTEAGLAWQPLPWQPDEPVLSFPGKLTVFLHRRFQAFGGDPGKGLLHLPCELVDNNGDLLQQLVLRHGEEWGLSADFLDWVRHHNRFLNTLVDRIVTGYPADAEALFAEWGMRDPLMTAAEPYHFWAIEGEEALEEELPFRKAGLNVVWTKDLAPYRLRKVRILNGMHTMMAAIGLSRGLAEVREALEHPVWGPKFMRGLFDEILPVLPMPQAELTAYANETLERFRNPFIRHKLADIAMNSLSKWTVRVLPSLKEYRTLKGEWPVVLTKSLAALIWLYADGKRHEARDNEDHVAAIRAIWHGGGGRLDNVRRTLALPGIWGEDLAALDGLAEAVAGHMVRREAKA